MQSITNREGTMPHPTVRNAAEYHANMTELRNGTITPDEFRSRVRSMRERIGESALETAKGHAIAASNR